MRPTRGARALLLAVALGGPLSVLAAEESSGPAKRPLLYADDLGPEAIDVSGYPEHLQTIYREVFLPTCSVCHTAARAINAPFVEVDEERLTGLRREQPFLFDDPRLLRVEADVWKRYIKRMGMRPPCCGACPVLSLDQGRELWTFLVYDSTIRKTGDRAAAWKEHRRGLLRGFAEANPARYKELYEND